MAALVRDQDGMAADRVIIVPNFVDDHAFERVDPARRAEWRASLGVPASATVIGVVANLHPVKDHTSLVQAAATLVPRWPDLHLVFVGEGETRPALERLATMLGVAGRLHLAGLRPNHPNPHQFFDVSVLCSISEGFPNTLLEAMAAGTPVIATDVGGCADAVVPGETGYLVPPRSPGALSDAIERLLQHPALGHGMGEAGRRRAADHFSAHAVIPRLEALYAALARSA